MTEGRKSALTEAFRFAMILLIAVGGGVARYWTEPLTHITAVLMGLGMFLIPVFATVAWLSWQQLYYERTRTEGENIS